MELFPFHIAAIKQTTFGTLYVEVSQAKAKARDINPDSPPRDNPGTGCGNQQHGNRAQAISAVLTSDPERW